ncbi:MAG: hypothetical protein SFU98_15175 [Leptospiraceae bacterium]|nr:hypothetical protein [Leptospiraceae bacterium]
MKLNLNNPPRQFKVGHEGKITLSDCAHIELSSDEQITLKSDTGAEFDIAKKSWGYYATPSLNARLASFGLKCALVKSPEKKYYIFMIETGKEKEFNDYILDEGHEIIHWIDSTENLEKLENKLKEK